MSNQHDAPDTSGGMTGRTLALGLYLRAAYVGVAIAAAGTIGMFTSDTSPGQATLLLATGVALALLTGWRARNLLNGVDAAPTNNVSSADAERVLAPRAAAF